MPRRVRAELLRALRLQPEALDEEIQRWEFDPRTESWAGLLRDLRDEPAARLTREGTGAWAGALREAAEGLRPCRYLPHSGARIRSVDELDGTERQDELDVADESRGYLLASTDAGWGVWKKDDTSGEAIALFGPDDDGYEQAADYFERLTKAARRERSLWLDALRWSALISGCAWIALTAFVQVRFTIRGTNFFSEIDSDLFLWAQTLGSIAYPIFVVSAGAFILLWLRRRSS